jgi:hypothetical protein
MLRIRDRVSFVMPADEVCLRCQKLAVPRAMEEDLHALHGEVWTVVAVGQQRVEPWMTVITIDHPRAKRQWLVYARVLARITPSWGDILAAVRARLLDDLARLFSLRADDDPAPIPAPPAPASPATSPAPPASDARAPCDEHFCRATLRAILRYPAVVADVLALAALNVDESYSPDDLDILDELLSLARAASQTIDTTTSMC